ncbi:hypothetical protein P5V15_002894 [Pogonomyrmex californicus]
MLNYGSLPSVHAFSRLTAFIEQSIIRIGGRLKLTNSQLPRHRHPAILPRNSQLSSLIIDDTHKAILHSGTQLTLAKIRQTY